MKTILDGFLWAFGITLGLGLIGLVLSSFGSFSSYPFTNSEFPTLPPSEYSELKTTIREIPSEHEGMFSYIVSGNLELKKQSQYNTAEVFVSLYNKEGVFLGEYSGGKQVIDQAQGVIGFKIDVWEPYADNEIVEQKFKVSAK